MKWGFMVDLYEAALKTADIEEREQSVKWYNSESKEEQEKHLKLMLGWIKIREHALRMRRDSYRIPGLMWVACSNGIKQLFGKASEDD